MKKILFIFLIITSFAKGYSCSCFPMKVKEGIKKADVIFIGQVLQVDTFKVVLSSFIRAKIATPDSGGYTVNHLVTLRIKKMLKGNIKSDTIQVMTGQGGGDCGYFFKLKTDYIIYANLEDYYLIDSVDKNTAKFKSHKKVFFTTEDCDRTTNNIKKEQFLLKKYLKNRKITAHNIGLSKKLADIS